VQVRKWEVDFAWLYHKSKEASRHGDVSQPFFNEGLTDGKNTYEA